MSFEFESIPISEQNGGKAKAWRLQAKRGISLDQDVLANNRSIDDEGK